MPPVIVFFTASLAARPNRHWTDEECMSRFLGDLTAMDRRAARERAYLRGAVLLGVMVWLIILGMAL